MGRACSCVSLNEDRLRQYRVRALPDLAQETSVSEDFVAQASFVMTSMLIRICICFTGFIRFPRTMRVGGVNIFSLCILRRR